MNFEMPFTLSSGVKLPAVGIGTFMMQPEQAEQAVYTALTYISERAVDRVMPASGVAREHIFLSANPDHIILILI